MASAIESNEYYDCVLYPEEAEEKQGITIKGTVDEFRLPVERMRQALGRKDARERTYGKLTFKLMAPILERNSKKSVVCIKGLGQWAKCAITIFRSSTISIARVKLHTIEVVIDFTTNIVIPMLKTLIEEQEKGEGEKSVV